MYALMQQLEAIRLLKAQNASYFAVVMERLAAEDRAKIVRQRVLQFAIYDLGCKLEQLETL